MKKLFLLLVAVLTIGLCASAQTRTVRGTVLDAANNEPLIGASVTAHGQTQGVATDVDGSFTLTVPASVTKLTVSYVGYETQHVTIHDGENVVLLNPTSSVLNDVIAVAYGTATRASFTGSAAVVDAAELEQAQVSNVLNALTGKVAGVQITNASGAPGGDSPTIRIRGISSINAGNSPLVILDGAPYAGDMNLINSNDIESMTVLKDAAANALYGARGANGVILITTKRGRGGDATVTLDAKWGSNSRATQDYNYINDPALYYEQYYKGLYNYANYPAAVDLGQKDANGNPVMTRTGALGYDATTAWQFANANLINGANGLVYNVYDVPAGQYMIGQNGKLNPNATLGNKINYRGQEYLLTPDNWMDAVYGKALRQEYNLSVSKGGEKSNFFASVGYLSNEGIVPNSSFERLTGRLSADIQAKSWLRLGGQFNFAHYNTESGVGEEGRSNSSANILAIATQMAPIYPLYMRDGQGNIIVDAQGITRYDFGDNTSYGLARPFLGTTNAVFANRYDKDKLNGNSLSGMGFAEIRFLKDFKFTSNNSFNLDETRFQNVTNPYYGSYASSNGMVTVQHSRSWDWTLQQLLNWDHKFGLHNVSVLLGHEYYRSESAVLVAGKNNMFDPDNAELASAITEGNSDSYTGEYNNEGWLFRGQYDYDSKYFGSVSVRRDGSSRFHPDHRWGTFWSLGGAWIISKESFLEDITWIDMLKIKASYGEQGNDNIGAYRYTNTYLIKNGVGNPAAVPNTMGNQDISWEKNGNLNYGVEFDLFGERLNGSIEGFYRKTSDMLFFFPLPPSFGYTGYYDNVGNMSNVGVEIDLTGVIIANKDLTWSVSLNGTYYKNKITYLPDERKITACDGVEGYQSGNYFYGEGQPLYTFWMPKSAGVEPETGRPLWWKDVYEKYDANGNVILNADGTPDYDRDSKGRPIAQSQVKTASYSEATDHLCGTALPDIYGGFGTSVVYKGFDFAAQFNYQIGGQVYDGGYASAMASPYASSKGKAIHADVMKAWTPENPNSDIPRFMYSDQYTSSTSDRFLTSASYLALQNVNIGYTLPTSLTKKIGVQTIRVYASGDNLWLWSKRKGLDPRQSISGSSSSSYYSPIRTISGGLTVTF